MFIGASPMKAVEERNTEKHHKHHHHMLIEHKKAEELKEKGYSKQEIFMGAILSKKADKSIDEVLAMYKENNSWEQTAKDLNIDMEEFAKINSMMEWGQFVNENEEAVIEYLATYSNIKPEDIRAYIKDEVPLRFLIGAAAIAKISNKELDEIVALKKQGKSFHDIMDSLNINKEDLHKELINFKSQVKSNVEGQN